MDKDSKIIFGNILKELFYCLTGALFILSFLEIVKEGIVLGYINLNAVLLAWLITAIIILMLSPVQKHDS
jgi:hypothetical protein